MTYLNTSHFMEVETEPSNYMSLSKPGEDDVSYSTISHDRKTEIVELSSASLEPSNTEQRQYENIQTREHVGIEKNKKSKRMLIMVFVGMFIIAAASSTITALLLKQNFDNLLADIREEMDSKKQFIGQEIVWSECSVWGECSAPCNGGIQSRVRTCGRSGEGLRACIGNDVDIIACNSNTCDSNCSDTTCEDKIWSTWSPWGDCSVTCNGGMRSRSKTCDGTDQGVKQGSCLGTNVDIGGCNNNACVVPMVYFTMRSPNSEQVSGKVTFSSTVANVGGGYSKATGKFVCPVAGLYHFYFSFTQTSTTFVYCFIERNEIYLTLAKTFSDGTYDAASTSAYVKLAVGDVVTVGGCINWDYANHDSRAGVFTGSLIHL